MNGFYNREWSLCEKVLMTATPFLLGLVLGFVFAPVKKGIYCGNHNGNTELIPRQPDEKKKLTR